MNLLVKYKYILIILLLAVTFIAYKIYTPTKISPDQPTQTEQLKIISTNPDPLEGSTILPTQYLEITFNKPLFVSEFKHEFDPPIEHEVKVINGRDHAFGSTFRIIFKKPLELGSGYTLFILSNTKTEENLELKQNFDFHFSTINYKGV